ncbi:MAG: glycine cleavage system protein GcvH [Desulfomonile tiedjei]|uniref:Glycine cleavage system H protein n=1 Tax=Desulfomonile tiedjei TaxID=2358 RepID=A0A9D6Z2A6_9BACT|nr:glycine cleavage system protein GcvH [Desulfomonile tiedjei]
MKEIDEVNLPENFRYVETHEWARIAGDTVIVGITDYAQDHLGDLTFIELPQVGDVFQKGEQCGTLESTKAVSDIFMPVSGEILAVNGALLDSPGLVNSDPYGDGWLLELKPENYEEIDALLTAEAYREMLGGLE